MSTPTQRVQCVTGVGSYCFCTRCYDAEYAEYADSMMRCVMEARGEARGGEGRLEKN